MVLTVPNGRPPEGGAGGGLTGRGEGGGCLAKFASGAVLPRSRIVIKLPPAKFCFIFYGGGNYNYPAKGRMKVS